MRAVGPSRPVLTGLSRDRHAAWVPVLRLALVTAAVGCLTAVGGLWWWVGWLLVVAIAAGILAQHAGWWWLPTGTELAVLAAWHQGWLGNDPAAIGVAAGIGFGLVGTTLQRHRRPRWAAVRYRRRLSSGGR